MVNCIAMLLIWLFILQFFKPDLILSDTTVSGGDTGSHNYLVNYMKNYLIPHGKVIGWSPDWYAGFPIFQFYFFLPYLMAALLSFAMPLNIAFKIITVLGTFLLPAAAFLCMKAMRFKFPVPILAAAFTLPFLFMEANSMWGGNIPSTLAGEFSYSLSMAVMVVFIGFVYRGVETKKYIHINSVLFLLVGLTHIYTTIAAAVSSLFFLIEGDRKRILKNVKYLSKVYILAFLLLGLWMVPVLFNLGYRTKFDYSWGISGIKEVLPDILIPFLLLSLFGVYKAVKNRERGIIYILFLCIASLLLYTTAVFAGLTDIRFIPFVQFFPMLIAAYGFDELTKRIGMKKILVFIALFSVLFWVNIHVTFIESWIKWNYEGFEPKAAWGQFKGINDYLASLPYGRVVHEFSSSHNKFGTPRAFEDIPLFSGKPVLEGLNIESAVTSPFVFWIQSEISETPTCPLPRMRCSFFDVKNATAHLKLFNVKYIVATSEKLKRRLVNNTDFVFLKAFEEIEVYELNYAQSYVEALKYWPVSHTMEGWKELSLEWFKNADGLEVPIVFVGSEDEKSRFDSSYAPGTPVENNCSIQEKISNEEIRIATNCIGKPLLVKVPYFPSWKVEGAEKTYLASPAFMIVVPNEENVRIFYGDSYYDILGKALTALGIATVILYWKSKKASRFLDGL
ncbi:MAG: 6-pyruvoyl-tetrahydropterin synthase-related protein [Candidatus Aenigmatarchaeota archaeon]